MNHLTKVLLSCLIALWLSPSTALAQSPAGNVLYVSAIAGGIDDGTSWANAYTSLQDAIAAAASGDEIWVAAGTYKPTAYPTGCSGCDSPRDYTFLLKDGVKLYGGFAGTETQLSEQDIVANTTILSGDIGVVGNVSDNAHHVVLAVFGTTTPTTHLDGFSITGGNGNGASSITVNGITAFKNSAGGVYTLGGKNVIANNKIYSNLADFGAGILTSNSENTLVNNSISDNSATQLGGGIYTNFGQLSMVNNTITGNDSSQGGGMFNDSSSPTVTNCTFSGNRAFIGGGMSNTNSSPNITNTTFSGNTADLSGGMYNENSFPTVTNCTFSGNSGISDGGGMYNIFSSPTVTNCTFLGNTALTGGGMLNFNSSPAVTNCTFSGNTASEGGGMLNFNSSPTVTNCIIWNNSANGTTASASVFNSSSNASFNHSLIANSGGSGSWDSNIGTDGGNNIDANPQFTDAANGDYSLLLTSPAVNTGDPNTDLNLFLGGASAALDLADNPRLVSGIIDMGAFENQNPCPTGGIVFVNTNATGANNGTSWTDAYTDLQDALDNNCAGVTEIWVAAGTYKPSKYPANCNGCNSSRDNTFQLKDGIALYGGFDGTETLLSERDIENNTTILSGDYNDDDTVTGSGSTLFISNNNENAYHVVLAAFPANDTTSTTHIDGFTITGGNANVDQSITVNGLNFSKDIGGGVYTFFGNNTIVNNKIEVCEAAFWGGGVFLNRGINTLTNNTISVNRGNFGGGAYVLFGSNTFSANTISNNTVSLNSGGGMFFNDSNSTLENNIISMNVGGSFGGGINFDEGTYQLIDNTIEDNSASIGGGLRFRIGNVTLTNNQINNNEANLGGGIFSGTTFGQDLIDNGTFIFTGNTISGNTANNEGGGAWMNRGSYTFTNNTISNNTAVEGGGGFFIRNSTTAFNDNTISGNSINSTSGIAGGGLIFLNGSSTLSNNTIADNTATNAAGILFQGGTNNLTGNRVSGNAASAAAGGIFTFQGTNTLTNNSFYSNTASIGGGMYLEEGANTLVNNSFTGNTANTNGGGMYFDNSSPTITNTIIWNNTTDGSTTTATASVFSDNSTPTFSHSLIANSGGSGSWANAIGTDGGNNIDADPLFVTPSTPGLNTGGDYRLQACSPAINAGSNAAVPSGATTDLDGNPRFFNNGTVDMGAYEFQGEDNENPVAVCPNTPPTVVLDGSGNGTLAENALAGGNSTDNCSVTETSPMMNFTCADAPTATVVLTATDAAGNTSTASCMVNIVDNEAPTAICPTTPPTVMLDGSGNGTLTENALAGGNSTDNCSVTESSPMTSFTCADAPSAMVVLTAADAAGNMHTANCTVNIVDDEDPTASCDNITVQLDANRTASITAADIDGGSTDNCGTVTLSISGATTFDCDDVGIPQVATLTVTDANNNSSECDAMVTVEDNIAPTALCSLAGEVADQSQPINSGAGASNIDNHAQSFTAGISGLLSRIDLKLIVVTEGNVIVSIRQSLDGPILAQETVNLTFGDNELYTIVFQTPTTVTAGQQYFFRIDDAGGDFAPRLGIGCFGLCDAYPAGSGWRRGPTFNGGDWEPLQFTDFLFTTFVNTPPIIVQLDAGGNGSITPEDIDNGSSDNCGIANLSVNPTSFDCTNFGENMVTLAVTDVNGNMSTCTSTVTVEDNEAPVAICPTTPPTVMLDGSGNGTLPANALAGGNSTDNCNATETSPITSFSCADAPTATVVLTATDAAGNMNTTNCTVNIADNEAPVAICPTTPLTVVLDGSGNGTLAENALAGGNSTDNCSVTETSPITSFSCADVPTATAVLTATDAAGNMNTANCTVNIADNEAPVAICPTTAPTVMLDGSGNGTLPANALAGSNSTDNCNVTESSPMTGFTCVDAPTATVVLTATDATGNINTASCLVNIVDNIAPVAICQNVTVQLDPNGNGSTTPQAVDNGSNDACGVANLALSQTSFNCAEAGANTETLTVTDVNSNSSTCNATVTVEDNVAPQALCQNVTVQLDADGNGSTTPQAVDNGSSDACGVDNLALSQTSFNCAEAGANTETLTVTDVNGNTSTCTATITVEDNVAPMALCQNVTVQLDANGNGSTTPQAVDNGNTDACGIQGFSLSQTSFGCAEVGANAETLTVTDVNGNVSTCSTTVTVEDNVAPVAICQNVTVQLDADGNGSTTPQAVDNISNDACGIQSLYLSQTSFGCAEVGANTETLTITDVNGNTSSCTATVTVEDNVAPQALCQNVTVQLDADGNGSTTPQAVDNISSDACGIQGLSLAQTSFGCAEVGANTETLTVTDVNGNSSTCTATVTVEDNVAPVALCQNVTVRLDADGNGSTTPQAVDNGSSDACGVQGLSLSQTNFGCAEVGANNVTLTVTDVNSNTSSCTATVTVEDNVAPAAICQNVTVQLDASGSASIAAADVDGSSTDNCGVSGLSVSPSTFDCGNTGANTVTLTVSDVNGNTATCTATVTVEDNIAPTAACLNTTIEIQPDGTYTLAESNVYDAANSSDNCAIASVSFPATNFGCDDLDLTFPVTVTVTDPSGNSDNCTANVTVSLGDALPPEWSTSDIGDPGSGSGYTYDPCAANNPDQGDFTISTGGYNLIPQDSDNLAFATVPLCGNGGIQARIESVSGGYAGLMIRESSAPGAKMVAVYSNLTNLLRRETRTVTNGPRSSNTVFASFPKWLRLVRQGDYIRAFYRSSNDGSWQLFHQAYVPMGNCVEMGLAVFTTDPNGDASAVFGRVNYQSQGGQNLSAPNGLVWEAETPEVIKSSVVPNPVRGNFTLQFSRPLPTAGQATLLNEFGQRLLQQPLRVGETELGWDAGALPAGLYFLEVVTGDGYREVLKVVRQ